MTHQYSQRHVRYYMNPITLLYIPGADEQKKIVKESIGDVFDHKLLKKYGFYIEDGELLKYNGRVITIPDGVECIGKCAFENQVQIKYINIPIDVKSIHPTAFSDCGAMNVFYAGSREQWLRICGDSNILPDGSQLFFNCSNSNDSAPCVYKTYGLDIIRYGIYTVLCEYSGEDSIVTIPDYVTIIGGYAFDQCRTLIKVNIPDSVTGIGCGAFHFCRSLTGINIPDGITRIEDHTFGGCESLANIEIPDSVTYIGFDAFGNCSSLKEIKYAGTEEDWKKIFIGENAIPKGVRITFGSAYRYGKQNHFYIRKGHIDLGN